MSVFNYARVEVGALNDSARALINKTRRIQERAHPTYETEILAELGPNPNNGPFYRLDDRLREATVLVEPTRPEKMEIPEVVFGLEFGKGEDGGLIPFKGRSTVTQADGVIIVQHDASDFLVNDAPIKIPKDDIGEIAIRVRAQHGKHVMLAWAKEPNPEKVWKNRLRIPIVADDDFHTYTINAKNALKRGLKPGGSIRSLFVKISDIDRDRVEIDFIRFLSKRGKYLGTGRGAAYETINKEMRRVLYMLPDQTLEYALSVPSNSPVLDFGIGVLENNPVKFEVTLLDGGNTITLYDEETANATEWQDTRLDLERWAGRSVGLRISVRGSQDNVGFWSNPIVSSDPQKRFNVIIILEDALRADHLSTYGYEIATAPFKDRLMDLQGILFLNAISQATKTRPSVPSMMTSLLPTATNVWHFADMLSDEYLTLAEIMRSQGFVTASFIQNGNAGPYAGLHQGFGTLLDSEASGHTTESLFGERLMEWLERNQDRNVFLYLHVADPHGVYDPPSPYDEWFRDIAPGGTPKDFDDSMDAKWVTHPTLEGRRSLYDGEIRHNDAVMSDFVEGLKSLGLYGNTLLLFTSDHGEYFGEHGLSDHHPPGFLPVTHVPLMLVYPERFRESAEISETVQLLDVMPTVLELSQIDRSRLLLQGDSLVDLIERRHLAGWKNRIVVSEEPSAMDKSVASRNTGLRVFGSLFYRNWHFIASRNFWPEGEFVPEALRFKAFDFHRDHDAQYPLYSFFPDLYLRYRYISILNEVQATNRGVWRKLTNGGQGQSYKYDPEVLERLKTLGYVN